MACVLVIASTPFLNGMMVGWTAVLPKLQEDDRFPVSDEDVTWLGNAPNAEKHTYTMNKQVNR